MSGVNSGYSYRPGAWIYNNPQSTNNIVHRGQSRNQIKGRAVNTTIQKPKDTLLQSSNFPIQQEKRLQITTQIPKKYIHFQEGTVKTSKQVTEMLTVKQESFQKCIKAISQNYGVDIAINYSGFGQGVKYQLSRLKTIIIDLQKDKQQLQSMKVYIRLFENTNNWVSVDLTKEWKTMLARSINDRKAIQECVIGNPLQYERIQHTDHTERGMNILKNLTKFSKLRALEQRLRIQLDTLAKQKYKYSNSPIANHQNLPIQKVYDYIKQHLSTALQEELAQQRKKSEELTNKIKDLSRQLESSRSTATFNAPTAADLYKNLQDQFYQLRRAKEALQDSKNEQINKLKSEIAKLQQGVKEAGYKQGSNSRIQIKETNIRQLQSLLKQKQVGLTSQIQINAKLKGENETLRKDVDGLKEKLKNTAQQASSVQLSLKFTLKDYGSRLEQYEVYIRKIMEDKKIFERHVKQMQANLDQKEPQIIKLNALIAQREKQIHLLKSNQKQIKEQYEHIIKEKRGFQEDLQNQRLRVVDQRKSSDASRQLLIKQLDQLQRSFDKLEEQARQVDTSYKSLQIEHKQLKNKLENLQSSANRQQSSSQLKQNNPEITHLQNLIKKKDQQITQLKIAISISNKNEALGAQLSRLRSENIQQKQDIATLNLNLSSKTKQLQQRKEHQKLILQKFHQVELNLKQSESKTVGLQRQNNELSSIISRHERSIKAKDEEIKQLIHNSEILQQMMSEMADLKVNSSFTVEENPQQSSKATQLQDKISRLNKQISQCKDTQKRLEAELKNKETRIAELSAQQLRRDGELSRNIQTILYQSSQLKNRMREMQQLSKMNVDDQVRIKALYQHQMLNDYSQYKLFLTETLQDHYNRRIKRTKLIFYYDLLNKVNFHQYIDGVSSLLLIIKTATGMFLAGYTEGPFLRRSSDRDGLILSLTNRKYFTLLEHNRRAITYDEYYIIFGNSEIRLKSLENRVFSNFGISNGYYNSKGQRVTVLLGGGQHDREMDIESYEIYQVLFDDY